MQTVTATDADLPAQTVTYSISGGNDAGFFTIDGATGDLSFLAAPDFEAPADFDGDNVYEVEVTADDNAGNTTPQLISVTVDPVNDNSPVFTTPAAVNVNENTTFVQTVNATDADQPAQTVTYSISGGNDAGFFTIDGATGDLSFLARPDFETAADFDGDNVYEVEVTADDNAGNTTPQLISVTVTDANEGVVSPLSDSDAAADGVDENAAGTGVGITAFASDPDGIDAVSYSLDDDAGGRFTIDSNTGVVTTTGPLDAETTTSHAITVRATSTDGSSSTRGFTVAIHDLDEFDISPINDSDAAADGVKENSAGGTVVGVTALASDADVSDGVTYSLDDDAGGRVCDRQQYRRRHHDRSAGCRNGH